MTLDIDHAFLPATLTGHPMTDEEFAALCAEHPDLAFEMTAEGEIIVIPPTYSLTGFRNFELGGQLRDWAKKDGRGKGCDSSTGFVLPNGARRSPDAAWVLKSRMAQLDPKTLDLYWHLCPEFVIELKSATDRPKAVHAKMREWIENGAQLGWLIDPATRSVTIYRPEVPEELRADVDSVAGEGLVAGFVLDLLPIWNPLS